MLDWTASGRPEHQPPARRLPRNGNRRRERSGDSEQRPAKALEFLKCARQVAANGNDISTALTWMARARQSEPEGGPQAPPRDDLVRHHLERAFPLRDGVSVATLQRDRVWLSHRAVDGATYQHNRVEPRVEPGRGLVEGPGATRPTGQTNRYAAASGRAIAAHGFGNRRSLHPGHGTGKRKYSDLGTTLKGGWLKPPPETGRAKQGGSKAAVRQ